MAHRIRGMFANAPAVSRLIARIAAASLGTWPARRLLESPSWGATETPPHAPTLEVERSEIALPASPYDVAPTDDGRCIFVSLQEPDGTQRSPGTVAVLQRDRDAIRVEHKIPLQAAPGGMTLVRDGSLLAVANSHGVVLIDVEAARNRDRDSIVSTAHYGRDLQTVQVLESADGRWLLASDEHNRTVSVLDLGRAAEGAAGADALVSQIPVDLLPVGMALSPDGRHVHVTCQMERAHVPDLVNWFVWSATLRGTLRRAGLLCTIDLERAVNDPDRAVVDRRVAGGHPVRVEISSGDRAAWVTARQSNQLMGFSTEKPGSPQPVATLPVGPAPVGLAVLEELGVVLVANSDRFAPGKPRATVSVIDTERAIAGRPAILGEIPVGSFPREIVVDVPHGIVYVTNFDSGSLSVISIDSLEHAVESARGDPDG